MIRRSLRSLLNLAAALVVLGMAVVGLEWYLTAVEQQERCGTTDPFAASDMFLPSPSMHHTLRPGVAWKTPASGGTFTINKLGLRGPEPAVPKPKGTYRVLLLGDEAIFTPSVTQTNTTAGRLRALFKTGGSDRVEVINGGVPGYCPLLCLLSYRESLSSLQADLVVLHCSSNDVDNDYRYRSFLRSDRESGQSIAVSHPALTGRCAIGETTHSVTQFAIGRWFLRQILDSPGDAVRPPETTPIPHDLRLRHSLQPIKELAGLTEKFSTRLVVTCSPTEAEIVNGQPTRSWRRLNQAVGDFARRNNVEFCDTAAGYSNGSGAILVDNDPSDESRWTRSPKPTLAVQLANYLTQGRNHRGLPANVDHAAGTRSDHSPKHD